MKLSDLNKKQSFLFRFVTSYSIILVLVLFMGFFFSYSALNNATNHMYRRNCLLLENSVEELDTSFRLFSTLSAQATSNDSLRSLLYSKEVSPKYYSLAKESMDYLTNLLSLQGILPVTGFQIFLPETNYLLSSTSFINTDLYFHYDKTGIATQYENWYETLSSYNNMKTLLPLNSYFTGINSYIYKLQLSNYNSQNMTPGIACFEIRPSDLRNVFDNLLSGSSAVLFVTDENGVSLFSTAENLTLTTSFDKISSMITDDLPYDTAEFKEGNTKYSVTKAVSSYNSWNYYLVQPSSYLLNDLADYQKTYILAICITCLATFLLIYSLSKANVKPIIAINDQLATSQEENETLQVANESLRDSLERQRPLVYNTYVARIMRGYSFTSRDVEEISSFLHLDLSSHRYYYILFASVYLEQLEFYREENDSPSLSVQSKLSEYEDMIYQSFYQYFGDDILIYHPDVNNFALLLNTETKPMNCTFVNQVQEQFIQLHSYLLDEHSLWIFGGLGDGNTRLPYFWKSYQQAMEAASYVREGNIFQIYQNITRNNEAYYYPFEMAQQLTNFIHANNESQILEIFKLIQRENFEYRSLSIQTVKWLLSDIRNTLAKIRYSVLETSDSKEQLAVIDTDFQQTKSLELMEKIAITLASLFQPKQDSNQLINTIQKYILENYSDSELSLKKISEQFDISESYFSYLFKAETKKNFSEYLEEIRMQEAMRLVKESNVALSDLYLSLGYNNSNSFRRAFKKVHGVSPKVIRDASSTIL